MKGHANRIIIIKFTLEIKLELKPKSEKAIGIFCCGRDLKKGLIPITYFIAFNPKFVQFNPIGIIEK